MTEERFEVAIYDNKVIGGYCVLDKDKLCPTCRLKYHSVFISTEVDCVIVADLLNELNNEKEVYRMLWEEMSYYFSDDIDGFMDLDGRDFKRLQRLAKGLVD